MAKPPLVECDVAETVGHRFQLGQPHSRIGDTCVDEDDRVP
jgi:hypothetical protein